MIIMIYEDFEDTKLYPDFDSFAREKLDDYHLPDSLKGAIEIDTSGSVAMVWIRNLDDLQAYADDWNEQATLEFRERIGL